jgi:hypothetical protein
MMAWLLSVHSSLTGPSICHGKVLSFLVLLAAIMTNGPTDILLVIAGPSVSVPSIGEEQPRMLLRADMMLFIVGL